MKVQVKDEIAAAIESDGQLKKLLQQGRFGLEVERARVDAEGKLALTPHPSALGNKGEHPYITTDFSESQLELVTPPLESLEEAYGFMLTLHDVAQDAMEPGELLWPQSMPPILPDEDKIPVAQFDGDERLKTEYRSYLSQVYGRSRQMICGTHFNLSFLESFIERLAEALSLSPSETRERVYLKVARNLMRRRWLWVGLVGRSPVAHESLRLKSLDSESLIPICCDFGVSIRCSKIGYRNREPLVTDYCCWSGYKADLGKHVSRGKLLNPNELYLPVRLKTVAAGERVSHIEIRAVDLDPFDRAGVSLDSLRLLHLFFMYSLVADEEGAFGPDAQERADAMQNQVACWGFRDDPPRGCEASNSAFALRASAGEELMRMENVLRPLLGDRWQRFESVVDWAKSVANDSELHPASRLRGEIARLGFVEFHMDRAREQKEAMVRSSYRFHAYADMELSTQLLLKAAVRRGLNFDILDRKQNFVRLRKGSKSELVIQATKTSLDRYSQILAMENKKVTKQLLAERGIPVPEGSDYESIESAIAAWPTHAGSSLVVKPMNTNFGLGVSVLSGSPTRESYERAVAAAFGHDGQILVERFIPGKEFRYFLIEGQVAAILHREPANVVGDGTLTVAELVAQKNTDPLRGKGYRTPLERIQLSDTELRFLQYQGLGPESVPADGARIYLRENSNISTGGDSIDYTERAHPSYGRIAAAAAEAIGARIVGLDLIAANIERPARDGDYAIIELNFNPAIHIHCFPHQGSNRQLNERILSALGFV